MAMIERLIGCSGQNLLINDTSTNERAQFDAMRPSVSYTRFLPLKNGCQYK